MDPVNIDFILGGNVDEQAPKTEKALDDVADAGKKAIEQTQIRIQETKSNIAQVEADLKKLQKSYDNSAPGKTKEFFGSELSAAKRAFEEEKAILTDLESKVNTTAKSHTYLRTQVLNLKDAMAQMEMAGKRDTDEYREMSVELERLNNQMSDTNMQAKILADDQKGFRAVASAVSGVAGAMSAATGVAALMGAEDEELAKIQTRLQAVMAITIGLQQVSETINKDSYFTTVLLVKAKTMWAAANLKVATTLGISAAAAKGLMIAITGGLIIAVTAAIAVFSYFIDKQREAAKSAKEFGDKTADMAAKPIAEIKRLSSEWNKLDSNLEQKQKYVDKNREAFKELGIEINNVADAESLLSDPQHLKAFQDAMMAKAKAAAGVELGTEKYKEALKKQNEASGMSDKVTVTVGGGGGYGGGTSYNMDNPKKLKAKEEAEELFQQGDDFFKIVDEQNVIMAQKLKESGAVAVDLVVQGSLAQIDAAIKIKKEALEKVTNSSDYNKIDAEIKALEKKRNNITGDVTKQGKEPYDAAKAIRQQLLEINRQTSDLLFAQREDNLQKTLDSIDREKDAEIEKINQKQQEIVDKYNQANKDKKGFKAVSSISQIDPELAKQNEDAVQALTEAYAEKRKKTEEEYITDLTRMAAEAADERVKIEHDYEADIKRARDAGMENYAKLLEGERDKKISETTASIITETQAYKLATDDQLLLSKETTEKLIALIKDRVKAELAAGKITKEKAQEILDSVSATNAGAGQSNNPFQNLIDGLQKYKTAKDALATAKVGGAGMADLTILEDAANKTLESTAEAAGVALQGVVNILSQAVEGMGELGLLNEEEKKTANEVIGMVTGAANLAMGIASGNPVQIIQGSIELLVNAFKLFDKKSKDIEKAQKRAKQNVEDLTKAYDRLGRAVEKALGTDVYKNQREQIKNLQEQNEEYDRLIELERQKKKKKQNQDAIDEWERQKQENIDKIEDTVDSITEGLAQTNVKDLASQLSDALVSAFKDGENAAEAMGNVVNDVIKNAVINALKLKILDKLLAPAIDKFADDIESGGGLTGGEADKFRKSVTAAGEAYFKALNEANDALGGIFEGETPSQSGIKGDVANMTEQTGSALVGQLAAMRLNVAAILATSKNSGEAMTRIFATMERIKENTEFCRRLERIDDNLQYMKVNGTIVK